MAKRYDIPSDFLQGGRGLAPEAGDTPNLKEFLQTLLDSVAGTFTCAADIAVGDAVYISAASTVALADANDSGKRPALGIVVYKKTSTATSCKVAFIGEVTLSGLTAGATYYLSNTAGQLTATAPTPNAQPVGVAKSTTTLVLLPTGAGLVELYAHLTSAYGFIPLDVGDFTLKTGAAIAVFADGASAVPGFAFVDSKALVIRWNNNATLNAVATKKRTPPDCDITSDQTMVLHASKIGATVGDAVTFGVEAFNQVVAALHDADTDFGGTTGAMTGNATSKTIQSVSLTLAAANLAAFPASTTYTIKPTDGTLGTDDLCLHGGHIVYKKKLVS